MKIINDDNDDDYINILDSNMATNQDNYCSLYNDNDCNK